MTRMWNLPPSHMCQQHRLGEHKELHMIAGSLERALDGSDKHRATLAGQADAGNVDVRWLYGRHNTLEAYGGWDSPLPELDVDAAAFAHADIDIRRSRRDLQNRCEDCKDAMAVVA